MKIWSHLSAIIRKLVVVTKNVNKKYSICTNLLEKTKKH